MLENAENKHFIIYIAKLSIVSAMSPSYAVLCDYKSCQGLSLDVHSVFWYWRAELVPSGKGFFILLGSILP